MRVPSSLFLPLLSLSACEPMDDPGSPWEPVAVSAQASAAAEPVQDEAETVPVPDPMFDVSEPIVIHSSELGQAAEPSGDIESVELVEAPEPETPELVPYELEPAASEPAPQGFSQLAPAAAGAWPLRLVATVPGAQPPRAILGMPGGTEVVVTPGTMLPDAGVVVMAIGSDSIELAEVRPAGDHAVVSGRTLQAQRGQRIEIGAAQ